MAGRDTNPGNKRPRGITIIAILFLLIGAILLGWSIYAIASGIRPAITLILIGIVLLVSGYGLLKKNRWAWFIAVIYSAVELIFGIVNITTGRLQPPLGLRLVILAEWGILIVAFFVFLYYLTSPRIRKWIGFNLR